MNTFDLTVNVLDLPVVVQLIRRLQELALQHCDGCEGVNCRAAEVEVAFAACFEPRS